MIFFHRVKNIPKNIPRNCNIPKNLFPLQRTFSAMEKFHRQNKNEAVIERQCV